MGAADDLARGQRWLLNLPRPLYSLLLAFTLGSWTMALGLTVGLLRVGPAWAWALDLAGITTVWVSHTLWAAKLKDAQAKDGTQGDDSPLVVTREGPSARAPPLALSLVPLVWCSMGVFLVWQAPIIWLLLPLPLAIVANTYWVVRNVKPERPIHRA